MAQKHKETGEKESIDRNKGNRKSMEVKLKPHIRTLEAVGVCSQGVEHASWSRNIRQESKQVVSIVEIVVTQQAQAAMYVPA